MGVTITEEDKLYLSGLESSANRSRWVFYLLLFSTCLIFAYNWKLTGRNWIDGRMEWRKNVLEDMESFDAKLEKENKTNIKTTPVLNRPMQSQELTPAVSSGAGQAPASIIPQAVLDKDTSDEWLASVNQINKGSLAEFDFKLRYQTDRELLKNQLDELNKEQNATFRLPFLEAEFDINDFVFFSSAQLFILGFVLIYCLLREESNLYLFFEHIGKLDDATSGVLYQIAKMEQVFTMPGKINIVKFLLKIVLWGLMAFPVFVLWWIFGWDAYSSIPKEHWWDIFNLLKWPSLWEHSDANYLDKQISAYNQFDPEYLWLSQLEFVFKAALVSLFTFEMIMVIFIFNKLGWIWDTRGKGEDFIKYRLRQIGIWLPEKPNKDKADPGVEKKIN